MPTKKKTPVNKKSDLLSARDFLALQGADREQALNTQPLEMQLACVLQVPWNERMDMIMRSKSARELVQALPPEEVYWMIKQRGVEDSLPAIARTTHEQFQYLIDIDCWQREQLVPENFLAWYRMLSRCNQAKVLEWFEQADEALLVSGLKHFILIYKIEEESDISEEYDAMPPCTLDGIHFFRFTSEDAQQVLLPMLKVVLSHNPGRFQSLVEGIIWDSVAEAEDDALHWRQGRVAENGFPRFDESLGLYQRLSTHELHKLMPVSAGASPRPPQHGALRLRYALAQDRLPVFLQRALPALADAGQLDYFEQLFITIANKVMVADCLEVRDLDDVRRALRKAAGFVSIGLEHLSAADPVIAGELLVRHHPELLFRCGYGLVSEIAVRVRSHPGVIWTADIPRFISFYGTPLADTALGLVRSRPLLYEGLVAPHSSIYRDFESCAEVAAAAAAVDRLIAADRLLFECADLRLPELEACCIHAGAIADTSELTMTALLTTLLIAHSLNADTRQPLLEPRDLKAFTELLADIAGQDTIRGLEIFAEQALEWLEREVVKGALDSQDVQALVRDCLEQLQDALEPAVRIQEVDARFVTAVLMKRV